MELQVQGWGKVRVRCGRCQRTFMLVRLSADLLVDEHVIERRSPDHIRFTFVRQMGVESDDVRGGWSFRCRCGARYVRRDDTLEAELEHATLDGRDVFL